MAHRADGLNDIFEHDVTVRGTLRARDIQGDKIYIGPNSYFVYENGKVAIYVNGIKKAAWG